MRSARRRTGSLSSFSYCTSLSSLSLIVSLSQPFQVFMTFGMFGHSLTVASPILYYTLNKHAREVVLAHFANSSLFGGLKCLAPWRRVPMTLDAVGGLGLMEMDTKDKA